MFSLHYSLLDMLVMKAIQKKASYTVAVYHLSHIERGDRRYVTLD